MMSEEFDDLKDHKGRVHYTVSALKVIETIESCKTTEHLEGATRMVELFYRLYSDHIFDETEEEITEALNTKKPELHYEKYT
jgi:chaperonin GroEL (HSP60 family)